MRRYLTVFLLFGTLWLSLAQNHQVDSLLNYIVTQKIVDNNRLNQLLYNIKKDSVQIKHLAELSRERHFPEGEIFAYNMLGKLYRINANYPKAIYYHQKAYELAKQIGDLYNQIYSLNMQGVVYRRMDAVKSALEYHNKALNLAMTIPVKDKEIWENIAISHNSIGNIYLLLQRDDMALKHFLEALKIEQKYQNLLGLAINYQNIGSIYERKGDYDKALAYYQKSLRYNEQIHSKVGKIICNTSIGNLFLKKGEIRRAIGIIKPNLELAKHLGDAYYIADIYVNLGKAYLQNGEFNKAEQNLLKALKIALDKKIPSVAQEAYKEFSILKEKQGKFKDALFYHKKFNEKQNEILNEKNRQLVADVIIKQIKLENKQKMAALGEENLIVKKKLNRTQKSFYYTLLFLLFTIILGSIFYKQRQLNNERKLMNLEQNLLRAQMNPHFIFNSLNSLKMFIIQQKPKEAVVYLSTFSKLVRTILQSTIDKEISLKKEIETLKMYVSIENTRFSDKINFEINVSDELDLEALKIPPLLTQPFIENALWHGLSPKEGEKKLTVNIYPKDDRYFVIEIIDNGVGRQRAAEIRAARTFKRESVGIKLSEERLRYFTKNYEADYQIKFEDLYDDKGNPAGTKVIIVIPLQRK